MKCLEINVGRKLRIVCTNPHIIVRVGLFNCVILIIEKMFRRKGFEMLTNHVKTVRPSECHTQS